MASIKTSHHDRAEFTFRLISGQILQPNELIVIIITTVTIAIATIIIILKPFWKLQL